MITTNEIWVICPDNGCEGLEAPIAAFDDEATAEAAMSLLANTYRTYRIAKVPVWPGGFLVQPVAETTL